MMTITKKALLKLEAADPARAALARAMVSYLNRLCGCTERGDFGNEVLRLAERALEARLGRLEG